MTRCPVLWVLVLVGVPGLAAAQRGDPYNPIVGSVPVSCAAYTGQPVAFLPNPALRDVGRSYPEAPEAPPRIEFNPLFLMKLEPVEQLFWFGHVCAHEVLADADSEENADRWALQWMMQQGWLGPGARERLQQRLGALPDAAWSHRPGASRLARFAACEGPPLLLREQYQGARRWRFCSSIPGVSVPTSSGHVSQASCEEERLKLLLRDVGYAVTDCLLTASERCTPGPR